MTICRSKVSGNNNFSNKEDFRLDCVARVYGTIHWPAAICHSNVYASLAADRPKYAAPEEKQLAKENWHIKQESRTQGLINKV